MIFSLRVGVIGLLRAPDMFVGEEPEGLESKLKDNATS